MITAAIVISTMIPGQDQGVRAGPTRKTEWGRPPTA